MDTQLPVEIEVKPQRPSRPSRKQQTKGVSFNLPEKLFILSIDDDKGAIAPSVKDILRYGLAGAVLAELALAGKIQLERERLKLIDKIPTGDPLFDEVLVKFAAEKKLHKPGRWVNEIGNRLIVKHVAGRLAERNVITIEKKRFSWTYPAIAYPQVDASTKYWVKAHLRAVILAGEKYDASDITLLSLLSACNLLRLVFTRDEHKAAKKKVQALVKGEVFGEAVMKLLADIEAAAASAAMAATS
jgi:hypothetical protein